MNNYSGKSYIKFWGVRGSNPTPDKNKMQFGGDTSCVEIRTKNNELIILDMGTGLRNLGKQIVEDDTYPSEINIFLSHYHWDHIMGFFYFAPLYDSKFTINIHGYNGKTSIKDLKEALINKNFWPVDESTYKAKINFIELDKATNKEKLMKINKSVIYYSIHPHPNGANSFKIETNNKKIVYITDCEHPEGKLNPNVISISDEADFLIHDSHYTINDLTNHKVIVTDGVFSMDGTFAKLDKIVELAQKYDALVMLDDCFFTIFTSSVFRGGAPTFCLLASRRKSEASHN